MKIEIGESLLQSYLKTVKGCILTQTNWKTSSSWKIDKTDLNKTEYIYSDSKTHGFLGCL